VPWASCIGPQKNPVAEERNINRNDCPAWARIARESCLAGYALQHDATRWRLLPRDAGSDAEHVLNGLDVHA
jgi:hypothetical protein